jgi:hypothetical protein
MMVTTETTTTKQQQRGLGTAKGGQEKKIGLEMHMHIEPLVHFFFWAFLHYTNVLYVYLTTV